MHSEHHARDVKVPTRVKVGACLMLGALGVTFGALCGLLIIWLAAMPLTFSVVAAVVAAFTAGLILSVT